MCNYRGTVHMESIDCISSVHACWPPFGILEGIISLVVNVGRTWENASGTEGCERLSYLTNVCRGQSIPTIPLTGELSKTEGKKMNSWWMKTVRRDSGLAPTSEVFLNCVSPSIDGWAVYDDATLSWWDTGDGVRVNQRQGWVLGGREQRRWWHRIPHPDCPMAFTGQECISIDFQLGLWTAIGPRYARFVLLEPARFKMVRLVFVIEYDLFLIQWQAWVPEHS